MISGKQIRAARALADVSQKDATEAAGILGSTLSNIERGEQAPSAKTALALQGYFEGCGIEFLDHDGVRMRSGDRVLTGEAGLRRFFDEVYESAKAGSRICLFNGVPELLTKWAGEDFYAAHAKRMTALANKFDFRIIVEQGEGDFIAGGFAHYRWVPSELFSQQTIYVHGDSLGLFRFDEDELSIRVIEDGEQVRSFQILFDVAWEHAAQEFPA